MTYPLVGVPLGVLSWNLPPTMHYEAGTAIPWQSVFAGFMGLLVIGMAVAVITSIVREKK